MCILLSEPQILLAFGSEFLVRIPQIHGWLPLALTKICRLVEHDLESDWGATLGSEFVIEDNPVAWKSEHCVPNGPPNPGIAEWALDHGVLILPFPRECNGPIYDQYREKIGDLLAFVYDTSNSATSVRVNCSCAALLWC